MSKSKYLFLLFICLSASISIRAQFMDYGSDPARFKWNIVRLPHYNLVYLGNGFYGLSLCTLS